MSYRPDEKDWMAYLYGELEEEEKRRFDQYLFQNPDAREQLEKLRNLRGILSGVEDKEVIAPPIVITEHNRPSSGGGIVRLWSTPYFRTIASVAASLILVILVGKLSGARLVISDREVRLGFGLQQEQPVPMRAEPAPSITKDEVMAMINVSLEENNDAIQASLDETREKLDASIRSNLAMNSGEIDRLVRQASSASQDQIRQFVDGIRTENMQQVKDYFQLTSSEQKQYIENLLVDFAKYLQQQRNDDLKLVQTRMNSLEHNTDLFRQETEQILTSIITTVGAPVSGETKH